MACMNNKIVTSFTEYLRQEFEYENDDILKIKYSFECILFEIEKLIMLFIIFSVLGKTYEFLISAFVLFSIRPLAGGLHVNSFLSCFLFTLTFFFLSIIILPMIHLTKLSALIILLISLIGNIICAPISSKRRPKRDKKTNNKFRMVSSVIILAHSINILFVNSNYQNLSCYIWVIALQSAQLIIAKEMSRNETNQIN
jgi:accessory gene regulator B